MQVSWTYLWLVLLTVRSSHTVSLWQTLRVSSFQTGTRSTLTYLQFRLMGFKNPANWDDSWRVYGAKLDYPVADEQWYDFAKVNSELRSLENKIKALEAAAAKPAGK